MQQLSKLSKQAGISLLEVLLSLAIIAIILVMATQYSLTAATNQRLNMVRNLIGADISAIQSYGINNVGFDGISIDTLVTNGYLSTDPKNISCSGGCNQYTPWGVAVSLSGSTGQATLGIPLPGAKALCNNLADSYNNKNSTTQLITCASGQATVTISNATGA